MKRHNIKLSDHVVCYDTSGMQFFGFRVAWMLYAMGHENVQVLAGGYPKWLKEGKPVHAHEDAADHKDFEYKLNPDRIKLYSQIKEFADSDHTAFQLIDARGPAEFEQAHIPGAKNIPFSKMFNEHKELLSAEERKAVFESEGVDLSKDITVSCTGGISATVLWGALKDLAHGNLALNDGSMAEWNKHK